MTTEKQIQETLQAKIPELQNILANPQLSVTQTAPGLLVVTKFGQQVALTSEQLEGLKIYLNLMLILKADDFKQKEENKSPGGSCDTGPG